MLENSTRTKKIILFNDLPHILALPFYEQSTCTYFYWASNSNLRCHSFRQPIDCKLQEVDFYQGHINVQLLAYRQLNFSRKLLQIQSIKRNGNIPVINAWLQPRSNISSTIGSTTVMESSIVKVYPNNFFKITNVILKLF